MGFKDVMLNIATLGAHQRVKNEVEYYENLQEKLTQLNEKHERVKRSTGFPVAL